MTLSTFSARRQTTEQLCPPALSAGFFITASVFANIQINFHPALRRAGSALTPGANTHMENTNTGVLTRKHPGPHPYQLNISVSPGSGRLPRLPGCEPLKIITPVLPSEATFRGSPPTTAAVTGRRMQNTPLKPANQGASELSAPAALRLPPLPWKTPAPLFANRLQSARLSTFPSWQSGITRA